MPDNAYLVDTNILIYHTQGDPQATHFVDKLIRLGSLNISILTKIEFLGWDKHTQEGFDKCKRLLGIAISYPVDEAIAQRAIELRRNYKIKLADAVIAATALSHGLRLATNNIDDFKRIEGLLAINPLTRDASIK